MKRINKSSVYNFITKLNSDERKLIAQRFKLQSSKKTLKQLLFSGFSKWNKFGIPEVENILPDIKTGQSKIVKRDMFSDVLTFLSEQDQKELPWHQILGVKLKADVLYEREFYKESYMYFMRAYNMAKEYEYYDLERSFLDVLPKYRLSHEFNTNAEFLEFILQEKKEIKSKIVQYEDIKIEFYKLFLALENQGGGQEYKSEALSPNFKLKYFRSQYWQLLLQYNYLIFHKKEEDKLFGLMDRLIELMNERSYLVAENLHNYIIIQRDYLISLIQKNEAPYQLLKEMLALGEVEKVHKVSLTKRQKDLLFTTLCELYLQTYLKAPNKEVEQRILTLESNIDLKRIESNPLSHQGVSSNFSLFFFSKRNYRKANYWLEHLFTVRSVFRPSYYSGIYVVLKMMIMIGEGANGIESFYKTGIRILEENEEFKSLEILKNLNRFENSITEKNQQEKLEAISELASEAENELGYKEVLLGWIRENQKV